MPIFTFSCSAVISGVSSYPPKVFGRPENNYDEIAKKAVKLPSPCAI